MDDKKKKLYVYWEVHGYSEYDLSEREETNLITTNEIIARAFARTLIKEGCDSITFDMVESYERLVL